MTIYGWDASDFDWPRGPMDLAAAYRDGIRFFTHKAWEGSSVRHVHYGEVMNRARAAGIPFLGAYFVPRTPGNNGHGPIEQQVARFLAYVDKQTPWWRDFAGWFWQVDTEKWSSNGVVYDVVNPRYGAQSCDLLQGTTGRRALHYAPKWAYGDTVPGDHPLWASSYVKGSSYPGDNWTGNPPGSGGWAPYSGRTPTILQYSSTATIGRQSTCDANAFRGDETAFRKMIGGGTVTTLDDTVVTISGKRHSYAELIRLLADELLMNGDYGLNGPGSGVSGRLNKLTAEVAGIQVAGGVSDEQFADLKAAVLAKVPTAADLVDALIARAAGK